MQTFTGFEYLLIDAANNFGLDKQNFEDRIKWAQDNLEDLELLGEMRDPWKESPLYFKAVMAIRDAQEGIATGHMVGFDAVCSGMQIMSAVTGCYEGARATGLVDPNQRMDAYKECTDLMKLDVPTLVDEDRKLVKRAVMTVLYGSKREPKNLFGEDTPELQAFYKAMQTMAPGACDLLNDLLQSWQPNALQHSWVLPDNHHVHIKVNQTVEKRVEVDEMNHSTFTYRYQENIGKRKGLSNVANVIHSIDGYLLRSLIRRCSYDSKVLDNLEKAIERELTQQHKPNKVACVEVQRMREFQVIDSKLLTMTSYEPLQDMTNDELKALYNLIEACRAYPPFEVLTVHDDFKCHPNHMNVLRFHYKELLAELAESEIISVIISNIMGRQVKYKKLSNDLSKYIRRSNYALS